MSDTQELIHGLLEPDAYPWAVDSVERIDTHLSHVFLAGDRVIKIKQAVDYGFVDFRSIESRRIACDDECRLNRRLTSNVYLGTVPITRGAGEYHVDGEGEPVEWATVMRRLPADCMLDGLIARAALPSDLALRLAASLTNFHGHIAGPCGSHVVGGELEPSVSVVLENLDELLPFVGSVLDPDQFALIEAALRSFASGNHHLFAGRAGEGWIREGHGDLRAEHVCVEPSGQLQIFDCVEFSRQIRCADVASDLAFLLMDLERLGADQLAQDLLDGYRTAAIDLPDCLLRFYKAHRALVRAKVACLSLHGSSADRYRLVIEDAADYLNIATASAQVTAPALFVMTGLSGTGKSTVARALSRATGAIVISSDSVRKGLAGIDGSAEAAWGEGIYSERWTEATYSRMLEMATDLLVSTRPVILDATFLNPSWRNQVRHLASAHDVPVIFLETTCAPDAVARRLRARMADGDNMSDATMDTYRHQIQANERAQFIDPSEVDRLVVDTTPDGPTQLGGVLVRLNKIGILADGINPLTNSDQSPSSSR